MHEAGLMCEVIDVAVKEARRQNAGTIHVITLRVGRLAGVEPEALAFAFEAAADGTIAAGAVLHLEEVAVRVRCTRCGEEFEPPGFVFECPRCGRLGTEIVAGNELELARLEVS